MSDAIEPCMTACCRSQDEDEMTVRGIRCHGSAPCVTVGAIGVTPRMRIRFVAASIDHSSSASVFGVCHVWMGFAVLVS
jgi:hypothetical protein